MSVLDFGKATRTQDTHKVLPFAEQLLHTLVALRDSGLLLVVDLDGAVVHRIHYPPQPLEALVGQLLGEQPSHRKGNRCFDVRPELEIQGKTV